MALLARLNFNFKFKTACTSQVLDLRRGADLLVATPGRLLDLLGSSVYLNRLKFMVGFSLPSRPPTWGRGDTCGLCMQTDTGRQAGRHQEGQPRAHTPCYPGCVPAKHTRTPVASL